MKNEWWKSFYDENLAQVLLRPTEGKEAERTCEFLTRELGLKTGDRLFDQCCGNGRVGLALAQKGYQVLGIDLAESYINEANTKAQEKGLTAEFKAADAFEYQTPELCHGALNWWTSFGYAKTDEENLEMLRRASDSLLPDAIFALDYMNVPGIYRSFQPRVVNEVKTPEGPLKLERTSAIDFFNGRLNKLWVYTLADGEQITHESDTSLYSPEQLITLFFKAGFGEMRLFGDLDSSPLTLDSPRTIICGKKL